MKELYSWDGDPANGGGSSQVESQIRYNHLMATKTKKPSETIEVKGEELLKKLPPISGSPAYMSEILVRLIKSGYTYKETEMIIKPPKEKKSRVLKWKNIIKVAKTIYKLFIDVYFTKKLIYGKNNS